MGAVLNTAGAAEIAAELACCACSSVCGFICKDQATRAKLRYCTLLFFATIMCFVMLVPGMRRNIDKIPNLCGKVVTSETCDKFFGFGAVYRVMLSMTSFYGIFAIWTIRITRADSFRARFNNGFWIVKFVIILGITAGTFFIPKKSEFFRIWTYACLVGGFVFILYQIIIVIDFGHSWSVSWAEKLETNNSKLWYLAMILATILMFAISFAAIAVFYGLFAGAHAFTQCKANMFYLTFIVIQCFLATVISVIPTVQQELAGAGLLQSSVVILYAVYLTFNTLSTEPDAMCNPLGKVILDYDKMSGINGEALFGCLLTFALVIFACTVRAHTSHLGKYGLVLSESEDYALATLMRHQEKKLKNKDDTEKAEASLDEFVGYNYSLFHITMALASLHLLMILTNWHSPDQSSNMKRLVKNWASVWVQMASSFLCLIIYIWFLVTPLIRKIWGPLFGIPVEEAIGQGLDGQKFIVAKDKESKDKVANVQKEEIGKNDIGKAEKNIDNGVGETEGIKQDYDDVAKLEGNSARGSIRRFKSIESLRSAVSSLTKRKSKLKKEVENSQIVEDSFDKSRESIVNEKRQEFEGLPKRRGLTRFGSIESLKSGISAISNATKKVRRKLRTKLERNKKGSKTDENKQGNCYDREMRDKFDEGYCKSKAEDPYNIKNDSFVRADSRGNDHDKNCDLSQGSCDSVTSNARRKNNISQREAILNRSFNPKPNKTRKNARNNDKRPTQDEKLRCEGNKCDATFEKGECEGAMPQSNVRPNSSSSNYGSSMFKEKAQDPAVAREMLRLQWKILRMQAKVVKIQEKIMRIQAEDEAAKRNAIEAAERLEPPIGQSSIVAGDVYLKGKEVINELVRKEYG